MDWPSVIGGFIAGLFGGFALKIAIDARRNTSIRRSKRNDSQGTVSQTGNFAGGDLAGRDINKRPE